MLTFTNEKHQSSCFHLLGTKSEGKSETHLTSNNTNSKPSYSSYFGSQNTSTESCGVVATNYSSSESFGTSIASAFSGGDFSSGASFSSGCSSSASCACCYSC